MWKWEVGVEAQVGGGALNDRDRAGLAAGLMTGIPSTYGVGEETNHKLVDVQVAYSVADNCPGTTCTLAVSANEPPDQNGPPDWVVVDGHQVSLRAERNGNGDGRIYTIAITCNDSGGGVSQNHATVRVPHNN